MKKILPIITIMLFAATGLYAQVDVQGITVTEPVVEKNDDKVTVSFRAETGRRAAKRNQSLVFAPILTDNIYVWALPAIVVDGRGAKFSRERGDMGNFRNAIFDDAVITRNNRTVEYTATIPYQLWMEGCRLTMESIRVGCCTTSAVVSETMADNLMLQPRKTPEPVIVRVPEELPVETTPPAKQQTTGEKLAGIYPFVTSCFDFEKVAPGQLFDDDREKSVTIYFPVGGARVVPDFGTNGSALIDLMSAVRTIENSSDCRVSAILLAGFASPEGSFETNDRLAWNRAVALKKYIMENSSIADETIQIYNGSADWRGLRKIVEASSMPWKGEVLDIIDNTPIWDSARQVGRLGQLMRLDRGDPYRYMQKYFFPQLRNAAYVKVYFENK